MKLSDLLKNVDIQSEYKVVYYDDTKNERIEISDKEASDREIQFIYAENGVLYIEVEAV